MLAPMLLLLIMVESEPGVADRAPADGAAAEQARAVAERLRVLMDDGDVAAGWSATRTWPASPTRSA